MFVNMAEQMIQKKQLRSNKSFDKKRKDDISRSTILENQKKQDKIMCSLSNKITNMDNEFQESQYDKDFESYDDYQKYDENSNEQHVDNNV